MTEYYLTEDKFSGGKHRHLYGKAGEVVKEISKSVCGQVVIVQGRERFPVHIKQLIIKSN
jgi:hypothetical protein